MQHHLLNLNENIGIRISQSTSGVCQLADQRLHAFVRVTQNQ